jgi:hypothetical protein
MRADDGDAAGIARRLTDTRRVKRDGAADRSMRDTPAGFILGHLVDELCPPSWQLHDHSAASTQFDRCVWVRCCRFQPVRLQHRRQASLDRTSRNPNTSSTGRWMITLSSTLMAAPSLLLRSAVVDCWSAMGRDEPRRAVQHHAVGFGVRRVTGPKGVAGNCDRIVGSAGKHLHVLGNRH